MSLGSQYFAKIPVVVIQNVIEDIIVFEMILPFITVPVLLVDALYHNTKLVHLCCLPFNFSPTSCVPYLF